MCIAASCVLYQVFLINRNVFKKVKKAGKEERGDLTDCVDADGSRIRVSTGYR